MTRRTLALLFVMAAATVARAAEPETVMITLQPKAGAERALEDVIARHYDTVRRLDLLQPGAAHVTLRGADANDKPYFVEILTWRDASVPDNAPQAVLAIWKDMNALVESRAGHPGLDIVPMSTVTRDR
jgi:hypothetical protein